MGQLFYVISSVAAFYFGFSEAKDLPLLFLVPVGFIIGYVCIRLPQIVGIWKRDGFKMVTGFLIQYALYLILSFLFYGIGLAVKSIL